MNPSSPPTWKAWLPALKWIARLVILALVAIGIAKTCRDAQAQFVEHRYSLADLDWSWVALSCVFYIVATIPCAWFWQQALVAMGQRPHWWESLRAYYVGHLGKYVPGKALVVVIRAALVRSQRVDGTVAALAVFVETLTLMAVGAIIAAVILAVVGQSRDQSFLTVVAIGLGICAGVPSVPPIFRAVVRRLPYVKSHPAVAPAVRGLKLGLMARGWAAMTISWLLMGLSLWATLRAMDNVTDAPLDLASTLPLLTASIALATVAGFMSLIPGGLGVRELVVTALLVPTFGEIAAIVSAVVMRLVSLVSEVLVSAILYFFAPATSDPAAASQPPRDDIA